MLTLESGPVSKYATYRVARGPRAPRYEIWLTVHYTSSASRFLVEYRETLVVHQPLRSNISSLVLVMIQRFQSTVEHEGGKEEFQQNEVLR